MFEPELSIHPVDPRLLEYLWDVVSDILFQNDRMAFRASCVHQPPSHLSGHSDLLGAGSVDWLAYEIHRCRGPFLSKMSQRLEHWAIAV
jgi:hypothetical protein